MAREVVAIPSSVQATEWFARDISKDWILQPPDFKDRFVKMAEGIYPMDAIASMRREGYTPVIIGYTYDHLESRVKPFFEEIWKANPDRRLTVAHEIGAQQLGYLKDFLRDEGEFQAQGTVQEKAPSQEFIDALEGYRRRLTQTEQLAVWFLENDVAVVPLEHPDVNRWIREDERIYPNQEGFSSDNEVQPERLALTAIRRNIHGLEVIDHERPDIISVGIAHAIKYQLLLNTPLERTFYFSTNPFNWHEAVAVWESTHTLFKGRTNS